MKKLILLLSLIAILSLTTLGFADTVPIGTGTATTSYLPIYGLYGYNYTQQIYLQTQINKSGEITKLRFFYVSGDITNSKDWVIYMGHTTKTTFSSTTDWVPLTNLTQVFAGDVSSYLPPANNWMEIPLTTPFNYNNTDNLVIAIDENTSGYASMSWGAFTSGTNTGIYYYSDSINPDPANPPTASSRTSSINRIQLAFPNTSAPLAPTLLAPANGSWAFTDAILSWTPTLGAGDPTAYDVYFGTSSNPPLVSSNQTATTYAPTLVAGNTYYWKVVARNEFGDSPPSNIWSFKTPTATQLAESFENTTFPPAGWANPGSWTRSTTYAIHGTASVFKSGSTTTQYILSTPKVTITSTSTLDFWARCSATTGTLQIVYSPDRTTWTQVGSNITFTAINTWYYNVIDLSSLAGNNYYLGIRTGLQSASYYVDSVIGPEITPEAPGPVTLTSPPNGATMVSIQPTFTWTAPTSGGVPTGYKVYCDTNNPPTTEIADVPGLTYTPTVPLLNNTQYYWTVKAYNTAGESTAPTPFSFTTVEQGYVIIGTGTADLDMPVNPYYGYTYSQSIYLQSELNIENQRIEKIYYYWNGVSAAVNSNNWTVYMGHTPNASFTSISEWIPLSNLTQVFSGTVTLPAVAGWIEIVLNNPFIYDNVNNLVIAVDENAPNYDSSSQFFYCTSVATNRSLRYYNDSTNPDPANPPAGTLVMGYPNVMLKFGELPQSPIFYYSPTSIAFGTTFVNTPTAYQNVTVTNTGAGVLNLAVADVSIIGTNASMFNVITSNLPAALSSGQSVIIPVRYNPTAIGNHTATLRMVYNSTNYDVALSGNALGEHALYESFEGDTFPPTGWSTAPTPWGIYTVYAHTGTKSVKSGFTAGTWWLMTPTLAIEEGANTLTFWYRDYSESSGWDYVDEYTYVMLSTTGNAPENFTTTLWTGDYQTFTTTWQMASIDLSAYNGQNVVIAFKSVHTGGNYRIIDDVAGPNIYVPSGPPDPVTLVYPANGATGLPQVGFNLTWTPATTGGLPDYYAVYMSQSDETIYDDYYWETTNTSFNPVTAEENPITFNYLDRWYWTVEAVNDDGSAVVEPPYWFVIQADPRVPLPYTQDFGTDGTWPLNWTQTYSGGITSNRWSLSNTNTAGGTPYEMMATWASGTGVSRLISPPVNTAGVSAMSIRFRTYYNDYAAGITAKLQYSHDLTTWYDTSWSIISGGGDVSGLMSVLITDLNSPTTYIAWTLDGNHYQFDYWYVDDVVFSQPPNHDVAPVSWDLPGQVVNENTLVTPKATVINNGLNTETFTVTCTIGDTYTNTQTVSGLAMGMTQQVSFAPLTPALWTASLVTVTTNLSMDEVTENDTLQDVLICLPLDTEGLAENVFTDQFVQFNLATPGTMYNLANSPTVTNFMAGADWANGKWLGCEYDNGTLATDNFWEINAMTGASTILGEMGAAIMGIAYDDNNNILYGTDGYDLYTMNVNTGVATYVDSLWYNLEGTSYSLANIGGLMIDIAYDNFTNTLYGIDLGNDCLWTINPTTRELTLIGFMGIDINYAQDAAFDQDNGLLFLAGYAGGGALYWIDTTYGGAYKVGNFPGDAEVTAFAIPYGLISVPEVTIASNGTISWAPVNGAIKYSIYKATDPYGTFSWYADAYGTSWTDPNFTTDARAFYKVTAVGGMRNVNRQEMRYSNPIQHKGNMNSQKRYNTGLANQSLMPTKSKPNK